MSHHYYYDPRQQQYCQQQHPSPSHVDVYYANNNNQPFIPASCSLPAITTWHPTPHRPTYSLSMSNIPPANPPLIRPPQESIPLDFHPHSNKSTPSNSPRKLAEHLPGTAQPPGKGPRRSRRTPTEIELASKTLPCDSCDARFARKHDLDRHRRIHTLEAPYKCLGCNRSYRRSDARKRHWDVQPACRENHHIQADHHTNL